MGRFKVYLEEHATEIVFIMTILASLFYLAQNLGGSHVLDQRIMSEPKAIASGAPFDIIIPCPQPIATGQPVSTAHLNAEGCPVH